MSTFKMSMPPNRTPFEQRLFTVDERDRIQACLLEIAYANPRIVAGALLGSLSIGPGDQWSDLDLSFGLAAGTNVNEVLADWTRHMQREYDAAYLTSIYRVFMLPNNLQIDLSFTPEADFGAFGPKFKLLFGRAVQRQQRPPPALRHGFGLAVHHAVRARICVERERYWQAEYWISSLRDEALTLSSQRLGLEANEARGFDKLTPEVLTLATAALVRSVDRPELLRALGAAVELLLHEREGVGELAAQVETQLRDLASKHRVSKG